MLAISLSWWSHMDPTYPLFPIFAFLCSVLVLIPLAWHIHAWNFGTCLYMIWTALGLLNLFINSIIWRDNAIDMFPHWCDICAFSYLFFCSCNHTNDHNSDSHCSWRLDCHSCRVSMHQSTTVQDCLLSNYNCHPRTR